MSTPKHIRTGILFIAVCMLLGGGLFFLTRSPGKSADESQSVAALSNDVELNPVAEENGSYAEADVAPGAVDMAEAGEQTSPAVLSDSSVWTEENSGTLACDMDGQTYTVRWERTGKEDEARININDRVVVGDLIGDWHPPSNTIRYDFEGAIPAINAVLTISDSGVIAITNQQTDETAEGKCQQLR